MNQTEKKKALFILVIVVAWITVFWYSISPIPSTSVSMPDEIRIRDGQTVIYNQAKIEYLYQYVMDDNSTRNILMISGYNKPFIYELDEGGYVNLFYMYRVTLVNNQFVLLTKEK